MQEVTKTKKSAAHLFMWALVVVYGGGVIAHLSSALFPLAHRMTESLLFVTNAAVLYFLLKDHPKAKSLAIWCLIASILTFLAEVTGVATGKVFGQYVYGETLPLQLWNVPIVIGLNWVMLTLGGVAIIQRLIKGFTLTDNLAVAILTALTVVFFDWVMEPVAVYLDYWHWFGQPIPLQNYMAWGIIAFVATFVLQQLKISVYSPVVVVYFIVQWVFFVLLRLLLV